MMEELNQVACENLCRENSLFPTLVGSCLAIAIAIILARCLGFL